MSAVNNITMTFGQQQLNNAVRYYLENVILKAEVKMVSVQKESDVPTNQYLVSVKLPDDQQSQVG